VVLFRYITDVLVPRYRRRRWVCVSEFCCSMGSCSPVTTEKYLMSLVLLVCIFLQASHLIVLCARPWISPSISLQHFSCHCLRMQYIVLLSALCFLVVVNKKV
jgi:hypothetical protein